MNYLITGLGNMGSDYEGTRHNIGFEVVNYLAEKQAATFSDGSLGYMADFKYKGRTIYLLKPTTYMNLSGKAIRHWLTKLKIPIDRSLVILDDINLDLGVIKMKPKGSDGGHNGLRNIQQLLGTTKYPRLRIGIGRNYHPGQQVNYVLGRWSSDEKEQIDMAIDKSASAVLDFTTIGLQRAMTNVN
ncbi:MAG: aminoacyl-tRNA hydrolase [Saprospirales bacterium]|nr:MAG: aminoacyl-tRNA hydrolase [Saprospirales bacterium]